MEPKPQVYFKVIDLYSQEYVEALVLRDLVLRKPLRMSIYNDNLEKDKTDTHIGAFIESDLLGTLILSGLSNEEVKMRQVAVHNSQQGKGIGSGMVLFSEDVAKQMGFVQMVLNARKTAVHFYENLNYIKEGEEFMEVGIPHYKMRKVLTH